MRKDEDSSKHAFDKSPQKLVHIHFSFGKFT